MKKVLFATTALVMTAGVASAEVTISGFAEMGIFGGNNGVEDQFFTDIDVTFTMSGTTDNGLTFGASIDLDESDGAGARGNSLAFSGATQGGEVIFVSGSFGTITMGDPDGALNSAVGGAVIGGSINDAVSSHIGWSESDDIDGIYDGQRFEYEYNAGDLSLLGTIELDDTGVGDPVLAVGAIYNFRVSGANLTVGAGYQTVDDETGLPGHNVDAYGVRLSGEFENGFEFYATYTDFDGFDSGGSSTGARLEDHFGVAVGYTIGDLTIAANYGSYSLVGGGEDNGYAIGADYSLGGGVRLQAGYSKDDDAANIDNDRYDVGIRMSF